MSELALSVILGNLQTKVTEKANSCWRRVFGNLQSLAVRSIVPSFLRSFVRSFCLRLRLRLHLRLHLRLRLVFVRFRPLFVPPPRAAAVRCQHQTGNGTPAALLEHAVCLRRLARRGESQIVAGRLV